MTERTKITVMDDATYEFLMQRSYGFMVSAKARAEVMEILARLQRLKQSVSNVQ